MKTKIEGLIATLDQLQFRYAGASMQPGDRAYLEDLGYPEAFVAWLEVANGLHDIDGQLRMWDIAKVREAREGDTSNYYRVLFAQQCLPFGTTVSGDMWVFSKLDGRPRLLDHNSYIPLEDLFEDTFYNELEAGELEEAEVYLDKDAEIYNPATKYMRQFWEDEGAFTEEMEYAGLLELVEDIVTKLEAAEA